MLSNCIAEYIPPAKLLLSSKLELILNQGVNVMPRGDKDAYTDKQKRQAEHIEDGYIKDGVSRNEAEGRAWATVNKQDGGGKQSGSGRKNSTKSTGKGK